jgi:Phage Connector (GP10).
MRGHNFANNPRNNMQNLTERMIQRVLTEMCINRFKWENLPDSVDERFLELELFYKAIVVYYRNKDTGKDLAVRGAGSGMTNFNDNPTSFTVIGANMQSEILGMDECVPIYANALRCPDLDIVLIYSRKLAALDRTIEINVGNMRYSKVVMAKENNQLSWTNINRQHDEGQSVIMVKDTLDMSGVGVFDVGVPSGTVSELLIARSKMWNECMGLLGIDNANQDKKERLVSAEVGANDQQVEATRNIGLKARQLAAAAINEKFGTKITVGFLTDGSEDESSDDEKEKDGDV